MTKKQRRDKKMNKTLQEKLDNALYEYNGYKLKARRRRFKKFDKKIEK